MSAPFFNIDKIGTLAGLILLTGCTVGPDYQRPDMALPANYTNGFEQGNASTPQSESIQHDWWALYSDQKLNELIEAAMQNNKDLHRAIAQIDQTVALLKEANANLIPEVNLNASSSRSRDSELTSRPASDPLISSSHELSLSTSYEIDLWGKLKRTKESARAQLLASRYAHDVIALTLAATTTESYFTLRSLDAQIEVTTETLRAQDETLRVFESRAKGGLASEIDVNQTRIARSNSSLQLIELKRQRTLLEHQLGLLTGQPGLTITAQNDNELPEIAQPPVGLPSTLIENRPDVRQAEEALVAANASIGIAKANRLPTFSLTGIFGGQSESLNNVLNSGARVWTLGLDATLPIFDPGKYEARTRQAEAVQQQALADYQSSVETAFREVADALSNIKQSQSAVSDLQSRTEAAKNVVRLSQLRYDAGYSDYTEVLDAELVSNSAKLELIQNRQAQLIYNIDLIKALGGGWRADQADPVKQTDETPNS